MSVSNHPTHHRTVEPPNPVLFLIDPRFDDEPGLLLLHDRCGENEPLARGDWWSGSRRGKERTSSQSYRLGCGSGLRWRVNR